MMIVTMEKMTQMKKDGHQPENSVPEDDYLGKNSK